MKRDNLPFILAAVLISLYLWSYVHTKKDQDITAALNSCLEEVESNCKGLYDYTLTLEAENARLNKLLKSSRE
tara:strand:+ start:285 stop:503 length:219 start_codon:yes stop_codon:yes gene_type:complete